MGPAGSGRGGQGVWTSGRHCPGCPSRKVSPPKTLRQQPPAAPSGWAGQALSLMSFLRVCHRPPPLPASGGISSLLKPQAPHLRRLGVRVDCHLKEESKQNMTSALLVSSYGDCAVLRCFSRVQLFATPWTIARQAPLSVGFSRQEYRSGWQFLYPGDLPNPVIEPQSLRSPATVGGFFIG